MPPEAFLKAEITTKSDVYSFGLLLWNIITGKPLFPDFTGMKQFIHDICENDKRPEILQKNIQGQTIPQKINILMEKCWAKQPKDRPDFNSINPIITHAIIESSISDPLAIGFWLNKIVDRSVEWKIFCDSWLDTFPQEKEQIIAKSQSKESTFNFEQDSIFLSLRALIAEPNKTTSQYEDCWLVTFENLSVAIRLLGPLTQTTSLFGKAYDLLTEPWFHGDISKEDSGIY